MRHISPRGALAETAASAYMDFTNADEEMQRRVLAGVLCNLQVEDSHIGSYQWKGPLGFLERSPEGALIHEWWAIVDKLGRSRQEAESLG